MNPQTAVNALIAAGWSEARIAKEAGTSQPTVHRIKHGRLVRGARYETATSLIRLATQHGQPHQGRPAGDGSAA